MPPGDSRKSQLPLVFMYSGQGSQYYQMGRELYLEDAGFRRTLQELDALVERRIGESVLQHLHDERRKRTEPFERTRLTHQAIFMLEYALTQRLLAEGHQPAFVLGSSLGEVAAAAVAGILSVEDCIALLAEHAFVLEQGGVRGGMIAVIHEPGLYASAPALHENCELAAVNWDSHFVISGGEAGLAKAKAFLERHDILHQRLPVEYGFHSSSLDGGRARFEGFLATLRYHPPKLPFVSCARAGLLEAMAPDHFWHVFRGRIEFLQTVRWMERLGSHCYLDLGPSGTLSTFVKQLLPKESESLTIPTLTQFGHDLKTLGRARSMISGSQRKMKAYMFPGQGSQVKGMGRDLFDRHAELTRKADEILGYSIKRLCLEDPDGVLGKTQYTQPALYVVNALSYLRALEEDPTPPDYVLGHSLGEYNALFAAGAFDFETGLRLVKLRGELMSRASGGGMAAVVNCEVPAIEAALKEHRLDGIDIANFNSPSQTVLSGPRQAIIEAGEAFKKLGVTFLPLNVSAAFHSRYMREAEEAILATLEQMTFSELKIPVISNVLARPYKRAELKTNLKRQIGSSVQWLDSIRYLMGVGVTEFREIGPGDVLTKLARTIQKKATPLLVKEEAPAPAVEGRAAAARTGRPFVTPEQLGSAEFRRDYNLRYAYVAGGMVKAIASKELVVRMGKAGLMGFLGTGGVRLPVIEDAIQYIQANLQRGESYGVNLLSNLVNPKAEMDTVDLLLRYGVTTIEAAAYTQLTQGLVKFRLKGLSRDSRGNVTSKHRIMAKVSRPEVAELFLNPPAERLVKQLVDAGAVSREQAELSQRIAMADDICVEADSGGHTDMGIVTVLLPTIMRQRDAICRQRGYSRRVRVGTAGGIGTPEAAASAFILGADFVLTGSINQCTVEAGTSEEVKEMLAEMNVQDTDYAPAGDMFEIGAKVQVLSRGVLFPPRANKLHELWRNHGSWEEIDAKTRQQIEGKYFGRGFNEVYEETRDYYLKELPQQIEKAEVNPKHKLALVFRWYFVHTMRLAMKGDKNDRVNYQVHTGPAMGAFNQWVKGKGLESWRSRHPDALGELLMRETADLLCGRLSEYTRMSS